MGDVTDESRRVAIVTGAARGLGAEIAACVLERGHRAMLVDRDGDAFGSRFDAYGAHAQKLIADLGQTSECDRVIASTIDRWGRIDVLVNAAAVLHRLPFSDVTEESMAHVFDINFRAVFWLCRGAVADMEKRQWGRIVNITSVGVHTGGYSITSAVYEATKGAVANLTKTLSRHVSRRGILVNSVAPGAMQTRMLLEQTPPEVLGDVERDIPLGRMAHPREVAEVAAFLASEANSYVTGASFDANGGVAMA